MNLTINSSISAAIKSYTNYGTFLTVKQEIAMRDLTGRTENDKPIKAAIERVLNGDGADKKYVLAHLIRCSQDQRFSLEIRQVYLTLLQNKLEAQCEEGGTATERLNLSGQDLSYTNLSGLNFTCFNVQNTNLQGANLNGANFIYADLRGADMRKTTMVGTNLGSAILEGADLTGTDLTQLSAGRLI